MRRLTIALVVALAGCTTTPTPSPAVASPSPSAIAQTATPTPAASLIPSLMTEQIGRLTVTHPRDWLLIGGPGGGLFSPLFYLSNTGLTVRPCPTANPTTGVYSGCPVPLSALPADGVLVTVSPNPGFAASEPPVVSVETADGSCRAVGGETQIRSVVGPTVVGACLRGPDLPALEVGVRAVIDSLDKAATVAAVIACAGRDLTVRGGRMGGGTGTAQGDVYFTNVGRTPCTLSGDPGSIELLRADGSRLAITAQPPEATPGSPATLPPGTPDAANLAFNWANWCGAAPGPTRVRITLPGGGTVTGPFDGPPLFDFVPRCDNPSEPSFMELLWSFTNPTP